MYKIENNLTQVKHRIQAAAESNDRVYNKITLLAVSKKHSLEKINLAYAAGQRHFGENYAQEALDKIEKSAHEDIIWHFIGPIQSNKAKAIAQHFDWVHAVDRLKIAQKLSEHRPKSLKPLNLCIQVNINKEENKSGVFPEDALNLAKEITIFPNIVLRGLMAIPKKNRQMESISPFAQMQKLFEQFLSDPLFSEMDTLSMGMSDDLEDAIKHGANCVRIGTAIFGERGM